MDQCIKSTLKLLAGLSILPGLLVSAPLMAQTAAGNDGRAAWSDAPDMRGAVSRSRDPELLPTEFRTLLLDEPSLEAHLRRSPREGSVPAMLGDHTVRLPMPDGSWSRFWIEESPILSPELADRRPQVHTYRLQGIDDSSATGRLGFTGQGFHAILFTAEGTVYLSPVRAMPGYYLSYFKDRMPGQPFQCHVEDRRNPVDGGIPSAGGSRDPSGDTLTDYRLAITTTGEYTTFFGGSDDAEDAIVVTVNRVVGIYEREMAITFTLVETVVYEDPTTDPFTDGTSVDGALLGEHQSDIDSTVGSDNYDIGHIFTQATGGLVQGRTCNDSNKARGGTGLGNPSGDVFDVDFVSHEIGHQLDGSHTWNGDTGNCSAGQWVSSAAYEPGSGTTIMAYAGICGSQNVQSNSDDYFHTHSFDEITSYRDGGGSCGTTAATGNNAPNVDAGSDYTIPTDTPFVLTATGSDPDGEPITFNWEQYDLGNRDGAPDSTFEEGPLFRSRPDTASPSRTLPRLQDLLDGAATPWEVLPTVERDLTFRVTARDNLAGGGGVDHDTMSISVEGEPFAIESPVSGDTLECGAEEMLSWQVGGGSVATDVEALLSTDGGGTFSQLIASTPNSGIASVTTPTTLTTDAWLRLNGIDNIFFALSGPFAIADTLSPDVAAPDDLTAECSGHDGTAVSLGDADVADICDASPEVSNDAPALFPLGDTTVTWEATDASGNTGSDTQLVTIQDTIAPDITAPADIVAECTSPDGTPVDLGEPSVSDICDADPAVANDAPDTFPLGSTLVTWTATDGSGNAASDGHSVLVQDTTAPEADGPLTVSPSVIWPPNHRMIPIELGEIAFTDTCDTEPVVQCAVESNEAPDADGDGDTPFDIMINGAPVFDQGTGWFDIGAVDGSGTFDLAVRSERSGKGSGRVYTVQCRATDADANVSDPIQATIRIPHDHNRVLLPTVR